MLALNRTHKDVTSPSKKPRWIAFGVAALQLPLQLPVTSSSVKILVRCCQQACFLLKFIKALSLSLRFYLFMRETQAEKQAPCQESMQNLNPGPRDYALGRGQVVNC